MFDDLVAATSGTRGASAVAAWSRVESAACARRLAAMVTMLDDAYAADGSADRDQWCLDNFGAVSAHIGAAQRITSGAAANVLMIAVALRDRFPLVAAVFSDGLIDYRMARAIVTRGANVIDAQALTALDAAVAEALMGWEPMSADKTEKAIDAFVARVDPHALRRTEIKARTRSVEVVEDGDGMASVFATLFVTDARAFDLRVNALADTVCPADPRTKAQRRADAIGALSHGADRLTCLCDADDCPADERPPSTGVVVYVVAHRDTVTEPGAPAEPATDECAGLDGTAPPMFDRPLHQVTLTEALTDDTPGRLSTVPPAMVMGGGVLPGAIARRSARGARLSPIVHPGQAPPESRYSPSTALADFVRCRDLTCRFPGCRVPASKCDVDHTIPWPFGPTQASNLKCLCRTDHLLKTFWGGNRGWRERQLQDGTVIWTAPDGQTFPTTPGSRQLFPGLSQPTAPVTATAVPARHASGLTMPRRRRTRAEDRARRIDRERELIAAELAEPPTAPVEEPESDADPPPF